MVNVVCFIFLVWLLNEFYFFGGVAWCGVVFVMCGVVSSGQ